MLYQITEGDFMDKIKIDYTGWEFYQDLIRAYGNQMEDYYLYFHGCPYVYSDEIIGLSYEGVLSQEKLDRLYHSIMQQGYQYERYQDLHLVYLPNKKYTVATGGNHRPYLAKLLGIKRIIGLVDILIPKSILTEDEIEECESILEEEGLDLHTSDPYFHELCKKYGLLPPRLKVNIK